MYMLGMYLNWIWIFFKIDITWKMNDTSNSKNKFLNLTNLHLLWQLFLKTSRWSEKINQ
jgi:hypothetical protein